MGETQNSRRIGRSILAVLAGMVTVVALSIGTDVVLHAAGITPGFDEPKKFTNGLLALATVYRTLYGVLGGYIAARLAPSRPMGHALVLGVIGLVVSVAGAIVMRDAGPAWYPWTLVVLAIPQCWLGGKVFVMNSASS